MKARLSLLAVAATLGVLVGVAGASAMTSTSVAKVTKAAKTPGVTKTTITIGATFPYSGVASAYGVIGKAETAYYKWVNAHGGVNHRKIKFITLDDAYNPSQTVPLTKQLVEQDHVFAIVGSLGTEPTLSVRSYLNSHKVPQVLVATGASYWGDQYKQYPWTIGWQPNYVAEAYIYAKYIRDKQPNAKIAVLYQNDDYGKDYLRGFKQGLGNAQSRIVATQGYQISEPSIAGEVARLRASGANTFFIAATPSFTIQAIVIANKLNWHPQIYLNNVSATNDLMAIAAKNSSEQAVEGIISTLYTQIPGYAKYANTPGMKLYRKVFKRFNPGTRPNDAFNVYGMAVAWTAVYALQHAGKNPTRAGLIRALTHLNTKKNPFLLPGMVMKTSSTDHFPLEQALLDKYTSGQFVPFGKLLTYKR